MSDSNTSRTDDASLALCLSGGGLRATLFHLGVIQSLRAARRGDRSALESIGEIYSVSGGSILAAHLVLNWEKYCGSEDDFQSMAKQIRALAYRDIRNRVVRRWIGSILLVLPRLLGRGSRTYWLEREYESLYRGAKLKDLAGDDTRTRPRLHILSTSFKSGEMCSFSAGRFEISKLARDDRPLQSDGAPAESIRVAFAVTASSAFPPMFPPLRLSERMLDKVEVSDLQGVIDLSDGGVYDNLGAEKLIHDKATGQSRADAVVLSNAGASFRTEQNASLWDIVSRNVRASDIMMRRVADNTDHRIALTGMQLVDIRIRAEADESGLDSETQKKLNKIRTDLDRFPPLLADMLIVHGHAVGLRMLRKAGFEARGSEPMRPQASAKRLGDEAEYAARRAAITLGASDWTTYALSAFVLALFTALFWSAATSRLTYLLAEQQETDLKAAQIARIAAAEERATNESQLRERLDVERKTLLTENEGLKAKLEAMGKPVAQPGKDNADYQVWIQFAGSLTREQMKEFGRSVQRKWPNAPGAQRGGERIASAAGKREVRYGDRDDEDAAQRLTADIVATGLVPSMETPKFIKGISPRSLEIWVSP
ncbi:hypothetical protein ASE35_00265 [Lysobacter sp. Root916]|uniref:patatin-like phospholipase family protein n=1 Tax=Lysobacter sp. Root916 TaxID=1736606 RepID=UPI0007106069|nr:patatin-like phospholipase family protein [Lysobacter sp. Root916]KRD38861.1 hypothetical protein ASE35_00265 [Lysobacter sp. Root916]